MVIETIPLYLNGAEENVCTLTTQHKQLNPIAITGPHHFIISCHFVSETGSYLFGHSTSSVVVLLYVSIKHNTQPNT